MAIKPFNSVGGFSVGEVPANVILANGDITTGSANLTANLYVSNTANVGNLRTDNLLYANGQPWDLQEAAGANTQIQYNLGNNFAASANFTYDDSIQILTVLGNANITKTLFGNVANFSGNITSLNANLGNLATANYINVANDLNGNIANFSGNLTSLNASLGNLATANYVNVANQINGNIANFSGNLTSLNASLGNLATANFVNVSSNVNVTDTANVGNLRTDNLLYANGQPWDLQEAAGSNTEIQYNLGDNFAASANFTFNDTTNVLNVNGNANVTNTLLTPNINSGTGNLTLTSNSFSTVYDNTGNVTFPSGGYVTAGTFVGNVQANITITAANTTVLFSNAGLVDGSTGFTFDNTSNAVTANGNLTVNNANLGNLATANFINVSSNVTTSNLTVNLELGGNTANFSGNVIVPNLTVNLELGGNTANFSGNVIVPNLTVNLELSGNTANFTGNVIAANLIGPLANGNSDIKIYQNANVEVSIGGTANVATFSSAGLFVAGDVDSTTGNMTSNGSVTANGFLYGANANVTGQAELGSVLTSNITAPTGNITISAAGSNENIYLVPTGTGTVDVALKRVTEVGEPTQPTDATTKQYVDNIAQGLSIHVPVRVTSATNLNATYVNGGTALTTTTITGGKTITFSANHGLVAGDEIYWTSSFNGIISNDAYFVYSTPALDQITVKAGFYGIEVTTLTNATGLTQPALGNPGVGATLTNAGANAAISIDSVALSSTDRVLVQGQTNGFENGIYTVTTVGNGSTAWVLTRATTEDQYDPKSTTGLAYGDYFFVQEGNTAAGSAYVLTSPTGEILFGVTNIGFSQFSAAGTYSPGNGIAITGTIISANVDLETTAIVGGNIVVKTSANLTTPNIGDATFSSLSWNTLSNGNVTANNLSIGNVANIGSNVTIGGSIQANANISSNANINGNNAFFTNLLSVGGNLLANNITSNNAFSTNTANINANLVTSNATVNLEFSGNTANFSGNVIVPNLTVNLQLAGNTANFTGNIVALNTNAGNLLTANFANIASNTTTSNLTVNLQLDGNTANFSGNITTLNANLGNLATANFFTGTFINGSSNVAIPTANGNINLTAGGNTSLVVTATGANITGNLGVSGNFSVGNLEANTLVANVAVEVGDTTISFGTTTTTSITANQTIATYTVSGVTGLEFIVKGIDSTGSKYSMATVQAVTDGANADYSTFSTVNLGGQTGVLAVNIVSGNVALQVTPASSNSTVWTTQVRFI
jgi:hypothetical protein